MKKKKGEGRGRRRIVSSSLRRITSRSVEYYYRFDYQCVALRVSSESEVETQMLWQLQST